MSNAFTKLVGQNPGFNSTENAVLFCLAWHADDDGLSWPGIETIHTWTGLSATSIRPTLRRLEEHGCLAREWRTGQSTRYRLSAESIKAFTPTRSTTPRLSTPTRSGSTPLPDQAGSPLPDQAGSPLPDQLPEPSVEPSVEQSIEPSLYGSTYEALNDIPGYALTDHEQENIQRWLTEKSVSPQIAEDAANAMAGKLEHRGNAWFYGKVKYTGIVRTFYSWVGQRLATPQPPSTNGRRRGIDADIGTHDEFVKVNKDNERRGPLPKVKVNP